jgi:hypothetical protein
MRNAGTPTYGTKFKGKKKTNSAIWRNEKGAYTDDLVGFPRRWTGLCSESSETGR